MPAVVDPEIQTAQERQPPFQAIAGLISGQGGRGHDGSSSDVQTRQMKPLPDRTIRVWWAW